MKWSLNADAAGFVQDSCVDLRVSRYQVELVGATTVMMEDMCPSRQVVFEDLAPGVHRDGDAGR